MPKIEEVVRSLIKAKAGGRPGEADKRALVFGLDEYSTAQRQRGVLLVLLLLVVLVAPLVLILIEIPPGILPYFLGGSSVFAVGTVKLLLDKFQDVSTAHTLAIVCQGLDSKDAKEVLSAWLNERDKRKK